MNTGRQRRVLILLFALLLCLVMARVSFTGQRESTGSFSLWYSEADCPGAVIDSLLALCRSETGLRIAARGFADEQALGAAFENARPDLLWCSQLRAGTLSENGHLCPLEESLPIPDAFAAETADGTFFPLGIRLPLLLVNTALTGADFDHLEALLEAGDGKAFLASGDWAELLHTAAFSRGYVLRGDLDADLQNSAARDLFNALAGAAFRGALVSSENAAEYVRQGLVPCAVVRSDALAGLTGKNLAIRLLPLPGGGEVGYPAELMGFALLEGGDRENAAVFLRWLYDTTSGSRAALSAGLVPLTADAAGQSAMEKAIAGLGAAPFRFGTADSAYYANRAQLESRLRAALDLLA